MATIKQVAALAGVSPTTASYALNNRPEVKQETKDCVLWAAHQLNYIPNKLAQSFRNKRSMIINVITNENIEGHNTFSSELFGILAGAREKGYSILITLSSENDCRNPQWIANTLGNRFCDGYLVFGNSLDMLIKGIIDSEQKGVLLSSRTDLPFAQINTDGYHAIEEIVQLAVHSGKRRFAYLGCGFHTKEERLRRKAFEETVARLGVQNCGVYECGDQCEALGAQMDVCLQKAPDMIVCWNDIVATSVMTQLRSRSIMVPEKIGVSGMDDIEAAAQYGITTAKQPLFEKGYTAATLLIQMIEEDCVEIRNINLQCKVVKRTSL